MGHRAFRCSDTAVMRLVGVPISYGPWSGSGPGWLGLNITGNQWLFGGAQCRSPRAGIHTTKSTTQRALVRRQQTRHRAQTSSEGSPAGQGRGTLAERGREQALALLGWDPGSGEQKRLVSGALTPAALNSHMPEETLPAAFAAGTEPGSDAAGEMEPPKSPSWSLPGHAAARQLH